MRLLFVVFVVTIIIGAGCGGGTSRDADDLKITDTMNLFFNAWAQEEYSELYTYLRTDTTKTSFTDFMNRSNVPIRNFQLESVELIDAEHASVSYYSVIPEVKYIIAQMVFSNPVNGYPSECVEIVNDIVEFIKYNDSISLVKRDNRWQLYFGSHTDLETPEGNRILRFVMLTRISQIRLI